jgi:hypothetical protein
MENEKSKKAVRSQENAVRQSFNMTRENHSVLSEIIKELKNREPNLVGEIKAPAWFVLSHPDHDHKIQLEVETEGSNLDALVIKPGEDADTFPHGGFSSAIFTTKLTYGNELFATQRILALFGLHDRNSESSDVVSLDKISMNENAWENVQRILNETF